MSNLPAIIPIRDIEVMANAVAKSKLFGIQTSEQALALMLIAQAEGLHPAIAARDYHIIQGKPALKSDAMLARFQQAGGRVEWVEMNDARVCAKFSHEQGGTVEIDWDMTRAKAAGLGGKDMWKKFPRQMLRARVISEGIRTVYPGVTSGVYTPEEVEDFDKPKDMGKADRETVKEPVSELVEEPSVFADSEARKNWLAKAAEAVEAAPNPEELAKWQAENEKFITALGDKQHAWLADKIATRLTAVLQAPIPADDIPGDFSKAEVAA